MGQFYDSIPENLLRWIPLQHMFWVATAPLTGTGHVNVSPKGLEGCFHIVNPNKVWYEDLTGSGVETISHLRENGRITIMFSAFDGLPRIVRLFGTGTVHEFGTPEYHALIPDRKPGSRSAIVIDVHKVGSSCGYAVPYYKFEGHRTTLLESMQRRERLDAELRDDPDKAPPEKGLKGYWNFINLKSLDGLPGLAFAPKSEELPRSNYVIQKVKTFVDGPGMNETGSASGKVMVAMGGSERNRIMWAFGLGMLLAALLFKLPELWMVLARTRSHLVGSSL